jgi:putative spermidine/putrescine transport system permease protein
LSLTLAVLVSLLSIVLCMGPAWLLVRKQFRGKRAFRVILTLPMAFSGIIIGFLGRHHDRADRVRAEVTRWLFGVPVGQGLAYGVIGLSLAYIWFQIPRATLTLESAIRKFDWDLESAARGLGASPWQAFRYVLLPLLMPAIVSTIAVTLPSRWDRSASRCFFSRRQVCCRSKSTTRSTRTSRSKWRRRCRSFSR